MELLEDVLVLWTTEWWDGPIRGVATGGNRQYWFDAVFDQATDEFVEPRRLVVYELTEEEYDRKLRGISAGRKRVERPTASTFPLSSGPIHQ
jgi:hypothetical protein